MNKDIALQYCNPYGLWEVTTEGDCEGRTVKRLGIHEGFVDEIAFALGNQCGYSLRFRRIFPDEAKLDTTPKINKVSISFDIKSATWDMTAEERADVIAEAFKDRDIRVSLGTYYASVEIMSGKYSPEVIERINALRKLTDREKELLGLK